MMAWVNLAGGGEAYLAFARTTDPGEAIVHQAVAARTLELRSEREEALHKRMAAHVGNAVGRVMAKVFGG